MRVAAPQVVAQVVLDPPAVGHARTRDDDGAVLDLVDRHGLLGRLGHVQVGQAERIGRLRPHTAGILIEQAMMPSIDGHHLGRHRAVQEHSPARQLPRLPVPGEPVQQFLGAAHRERGNQHVAPVAPGMLEDLAQLADGVRAVAMVAVAVGGFHQQQVGLLHHGGIAQDGRALRAQVAGKHQLAAVRPQFHDGRTEDMAGIAQRDVHAGQDRRALVVGQRLHLAQRRVHVLGGKQRLRFRFAPTAVTVGALGLGFGQRGRVQQHDGQQLGAGALGVDGPAIPALDQQRHPAHMVDVGVAQHHGVQRAGIEGKGVFVARFGFAAALDQAAVQQDAPAGGLDQVHGPGDLARRAVEMDLHGNSLSSRCRQYGATGRG